MNTWEKRNVTTWRKLISEEQASSGDETPLIHISPTPEALDVEFDAGYGAPDGPPFLAWTSARVYFPVVYDGFESVGSAPRNPTPDAQDHVGSW